MRTHRSPLTAERYRQRYTQLSRACARALGILDHEVQPGHVIDVLEFRKLKNTPGGEPTADYGGAIARSTFRQYKAAIAAELDGRISTSPTPLVSDLLAMERLQALGQGAFRRRGQATSALTERRLEETTLKRVNEHLLKRKAKGDRWASLTFVFLAANRLVGLRPSEWERVRLTQDSEPGALRLEIENGKHDRTRGNGPSRTIILRELSDRQVRMFELLVKVVTMPDARPRDHRGQPVSFERMLSYMRRCLRAACVEAFPRRSRHPSLYSTRHQFAADAKRAGLSKAEIAALLGHASDGTAGRHYARTTCGRAGFKARALHSEVATVREVSVRHPFRRRSA
jgi:integrase